jgi:hypothetical protein
MDEVNLFRFAIDTVAGVDYSLRCPAICIIPPTPCPEVFVPFKDCQFYFMTNTKKHCIQGSNFHGTLIGDYDSNPNRFETLAQWAVKCLMDNGVKTVGLEGYAFGAKGNSLIDIAENTGMLKWFMHVNAIPYDIHPPTTVKKFFTKSGKSDKDRMYSQFEEYTAISLNDVFGRDVDARAKSPVSDIVDAYALACLQRVESGITNCDYGVTELLKEKEI